MTEPLILTLTDAAKLLGITKNQLYTLTRARTRYNTAHPIPILRIGRRIAFRKPDLEKWLDTLAAAQEIGGRP